MSNGSNPIKYSDLIQEDNSIQNLITQLGEVITSVNNLKDAAKGMATELSNQIKTMSGANTEQAKQLTEVSDKVQKLASDVSNLSKKEEDATRTRKKLTDEQKQANKEAKLREQANSAEIGSINRLNAQLKLLTIEYNKMGAAERESTELGKRLTQQMADTYNEISRVKQATGDHRMEVGKYEKALNNLPGILGNISGWFNNMKNQMSTIGSSSLPSFTKGLGMAAVAVTGVVTALKGMYQGIKATIDINKEFEQANANLSTIIGETRENLQGLATSAIQLSVATGKSATEIVQLQTELAKLGFGKTSIQNIQKYVLEFAVATGANLAEAAEVAGATLRSFNLTSLDAEDALGALVLACNNSALSFDKIKTSLGTVFPIAKSFGLSVKDLASLLGVLANAGFDSSKGATALRNILSKLADSNSKLSKSLGQGLNTFDKVVVALEMAAKEGYTLNEVFGNTDQRAAAAFARLLSGTQDLRELRAAVEDTSGVLDNIMNVRLDTLQGATDKTKEAWHQLMLSFQNSMGVLKDVQLALAGFLKTVREVAFAEQVEREKANARLLDDMLGDWNSYLEMTKDWDTASKESMLLGEKQRSLERIELLRNEEREKAEIRIKREQLSQEALRKLGEGATASAIEDYIKANMEGVQLTQSSLKSLAILYKNIEDTASQARESVRGTMDEITKQAIAEEMAIQNEVKVTDEELDRQRKAAQKARMDELNRQKTALEMQLSLAREGSTRWIVLRKQLIEKEREIALEQNRQTTTELRQDEALINAVYDKKLIDAKVKTADTISKIVKESATIDVSEMETQLAGLEQESDAYFELWKRIQERKRDEEIAQATIAGQETVDISAKYDKIIRDEEIKRATEAFKTQLALTQDAEYYEYNTHMRNQRQKRIFALEEQKKYFQALLDFYDKNGIKISEEERKMLTDGIKAAESDTKTMQFESFGEVLGLGLDKAQTRAINKAIDETIGLVKELTKAWEEEAEAKVKAAEKKISAAEKTLDYEREARANGYANQVETAQKELELAKKQQKEALAEREKAQKAQLAVDSTMEASSLVMASANFWKTCSEWGPAGVALAVAAIAAMWGSFIASKAKALSLTKQQTEQYGEGTVELLEGGSHASGHDIDLGTKKDGTRRRAEGGEYFAVINKRNSRRYRNVIPDVINSFNDGTFAEKYQQSNNGLMVLGGGTDVTTLEKEVKQIRKQGSTLRYTDSKGNTVVVYKNLTTRIR